MHRFDKANAALPHSHQHGILDYHSVSFGKKAESKYVFLNIFKNVTKFCIKATVTSQLQANHMIRDQFICTIQEQ